MKIKVNGHVVYESQFGRPVDVEVEQEVGNFTCNQSVTVNGNVTGNVESKGSVQCENVGADVNAKGSVHCENVTGSLTAGGSVIAGGTVGNIKAGGPVVIN